MNKTILCIDGGGVKGLIPAMLLRNLEERLGIPLHQAFDLIVGTSTGGIIAVALGMGVSCDDIVNLYRNRCHEMFHRSLWSLRGLLSSKYTNVGMDRILQETLGELTLGEAKTPIGVTVMRAVDHHSMVWSSTDHPHIPAWRAARATASAPTFFSPVDGYWDGGCWANNPAGVGYLNATMMWPSANIRVLSLGCGEKGNLTSVSELKTAGLLKLVPHLSTLLLEGGIDFIDRQMKYFIGADYMRVNPSLNGASHIMDNTSDQNLTDLYHVAIGNIEDHGQTAEQFVKGQL